MLEKMKMESQDVVAFEAKGKITQEDYKNKILPVLEEFQKSNRKLRFLYYLGPEFEGFTPGATWEDLKLGVKFTSLIERCAVVSDLGWVRNLTGFIGSLMTCSVQVFENKDLDSAIAWSNSGEIGLDYTLDKEKGIVTIEINSQLTSQDFSSLAHAVDPQIEKLGQLNGIILHVRTFPGWDNVGSVARHVQFVKNHHSKIRKVAFVTDSKPAQILPELAGHFVKAEVKHFPYKELKAAQTWAAS